MGGTSGGSRTSPNSLPRERRSPQQADGDITPYLTTTQPGGGLNESPSTTAMLGERGRRREGGEIRRKPAALTSDLQIDLLFSPLLAPSSPFCSSSLPLSSSSSLSPLLPSPSPPQCVCRSLQLVGAVSSLPPLNRLQHHPSPQITCLCLVSLRSPPPPPVVLRGFL